MSEETVRVVQGPDHVAEVILHRPERLNAMNTEMAERLHRALVTLDDAPGVRVVILKGSGRAFCAGIDVRELEGKSAQEARAWIERMERPLLVLSRMKTPVIAQVQGVAAANGMGLVAAADLAVAAESARMGLTAINVGLNCVGPVLPVSRCVGRKKALELLLFGELISAAEALALGLVNRCVPEAELEAETRRWAAELAQKSPLAVRIAKSAFYTAEDLDYEKQFAFMNEAFARLCSTEDAREGVRAFFEKRKPVWKER